MRDRQSDLTSGPLFRGKTIKQTFDLTVLNVRYPAKADIKNTNNSLYFYIRSFNKNYVVLLIVLYRLLSSMSLKMAGLMHYLMSFEV